MLFCGAGPLLLAVLQSAEKPREQTGRAVCIRTANRDQTSDSSVLGTELETATQAEAGVGCGCAQAALAPCCCLPGCCRAAASASRWEGLGKEHAAPGRQQPAAAILCTETISSLHMQLRCWLSYNSSKAVLVLTKRALLQWSQGIWRKEVFNCVSSMKQDNDNCVKFTLMHTEVGPVKLQDFYHCV